MLRAAGFSVILALAAPAAGAAADPPITPITPSTPIDPLSVDAAAPVPAAAHDTLVPRSALLAPKVAFWTDAFSRLSEYQTVIHSERDVTKIYAVLDFRDDVARLGPAPARRLQANAEKAIKREVDRHLRRAHALRGKPEQLSPAERKVYDLYADSSDPLRYQRAVGTFRAQRGLKEKTERAMKVSGQYLPRMEAIFAAEDLPLALTRLPLVESSFNVDAYSKVGAAGMWQFMPSSARLYMRLDEAVDDRRDPWTSTRAAALHLKQDYAQLGSWPLAVTAYNHGRGGVASALRKVKGSTLEDLIERWNGRRFGFASRNFYAEFLAAVDVERDYRTHFGEIERHAPIDFEVVQIQHYVSYDVLRKCAGLTPAEFRTLNPGFHPEVLDGRLHVPPQTSIRVPVGRGEGFMQAYLALDEDQRFTQQRFYYVRYRVQRGDTLSTIARRYSVGLSKLREANGLGSRNMIRVGQVLRIPPRHGSGQMVKVAAQKPESTDVDGITYLLHHVKPGQTLTAIAHQYRTTIGALRQLNDLDPAGELRAGAILKVPSR
jgi:membrane-bound lytic murein transglycosylase D